MKKFLSDVLINCDLTVSGSTSLGAATGVTVATSDNSNKIATTAWVKGLGFSTANTTYLLDVPANTTNFRLLGSDSSTDTITLSAAGASSITRVSASELRITSTNSVDYISNVTFANDVITFTGVGEGFSGTVNLSTYLTQSEGDARYLQSYSETDTLDTVTSRDGVTTNTIGVGTINVIGTTAGQELLTVDGTNGRLFTVTDDLSDSLFSVNTIAGLPVIEVFSDNTIKLGNFANPIEIDSSANIVIPGTITASGYNDSNWNTAFNDRITSAAVSGTTTKTLTLTQGDGGTVTASWTDINTDTDGYVSAVALNGNSLEFTSVGSGFAGSIDLSTITSDFNATDVRTVYERVRNVSGSPLQKGTPLAVVPGQTSGNLSDVVPADASDPALMPAVFILNEDLANGLEGEAVAFGNITGIDTSLYDSGTTVYVAPGGGWTADKPQGANLIQNLGIITKSHPSNGGGVVMGAGRSNDVPNIANGYAWVGNAQAVATPTQLGSNAFTSYTDHSTQGYLTSVAFGDLTSTPTTIGGYGITDAFDGAYSSLSGIPSTFTPSAHNHDDRYYTQTELDTEFNKYLRSDIPDSFNKLINSSQNITPEWGGGAINLKPSVAGGSTGIVFTSAQNINTDTGKDHGYLWWYDNNNNYSINPGSQENGAVILGVMNDSVENGMGDSAVVESSGNIFLNPGIDPTEGSQGGNSGPNFTRGKVYVGRAAEFYEVYHEGNLNLGDYAAANHVHDYDNYVSWNLKTNGTQRTTVQSGGNLDIVAGSNVSVAYGAGGVVTISSTDTNTDTNNYVTGLSFNTSNGILTATRQGLADLTVDLDGRYLTSFTETRTELSLASNILSYRDETGAVTELDLSLYLDDTNLARLTSGTLDSGTGIATFSRDDSSTFTVDFSALFDDVDNYVNSVAFSTTNGILTIGRTGSLANLTVDLDGRYLTSFTETDPVFAASPAGGISPEQITSWDEAASWGNHADEGYLTSYTEADTLDSVTGRGNTTTNSITVADLAANRGDFGSTGTNPQISIFTENASASIADTFTDTTTDKSYIYFAAGTNSNDPGYIMHETSENSSPDERNEGVLHLVPSDDNTGTDYVSIHGTNDPDAVRIYTDGRIQTSPSYQLKIQSGSGSVRILDDLSVQNTINTDSHGDSSQWNTAFGWGDHDGLYDPEGTGAAEAAVVNTRIDEEILPAIGEKLDSSVNPIKSATVSNDTITFTKADNTTFAITTSDANTNYYLDNITKSGNTLTYVMNGKTDLAYTFGSNAFTSYSNHVGLYDAVGTAASEAGAVNTRIDEEVLPLIQTPAILSNGTVPSLNTGISAAEIRTLIGAGTSSTDTNFYLSGASFNTGNGVLTLTVSGATDQTVDLDGRYLTSFTESDPVFTASPAGGITSENIGLWDEAHGWGDHAGLYANASHTHSATDITSGTLDGARLPWAANDGFSGTYPLVWKGDDRPYTASWLSIRGSDDTLLTRNISVSGNVTISSSIILANGVLINNGAGDGVPQGTVIETFSASTYIGAFLDFTIYDDSKQNMRSGTLQLVFNADQVMFNEVNTMDIGDTTPCTLDAVNNGGTIDVRFTTPDPTFHIKYHVRTL